MHEPWGKSIPTSRTREDLLEKPGVWDRGAQVIKLFKCYQGVGLAPRCRLEVSGKHFLTSFQVLLQGGERIALLSTTYIKLLLKTLVSQVLRSFFVSTVASLRDLGLHQATAQEFLLARVFYKSRCTKGCHLFPCVPYTSG